MANTRDKAVQPSAESKPNKYRDGRWSVPSKRAKGYAADRKARGLYKPAAEMREGGTFLLYYKYKKALAEGKSKQEAREISRRKQKK